MTTVTRTALTRSYGFELARAQPDDDGLTMEGYAAVFDSPVRIANRLEAFDLGLDGPEFVEQIAKTAFDKSISDSRPMLLFQHGRHRLIGEMPIGVIRHLRADDRGLFVRARLIDNWLTSPVRDAIAAGAITGMSFRADPIKESVDRRHRPPLVTRTELRLIELGPVVNPAYEDTRVTVRSRAIVEALADDGAKADLVRALMTPVERGAIRSHSTGTTEENPGGPDVQAQAPNDASVLRYMHAWVDSAGDPDVKESYKFPHHGPRVGSAAILSLVRNGLSRLPQADIPAGDRAAVEAHLRRHLEDASGGDSERSATMTEEPPVQRHSSDDSEPPFGHSGEDNEPPSRHSSMSDGLMRAHLARINSHIDVAERSLS